MSSSFRRARTRRDDTLLSGLKGTKPWTGGITLTSVGLRDMDTILGGGQPLGTSILLEVDRLTRDLSLCLVKYWCAEAISHEQALLVPSFQDDFAGSLPASVVFQEEEESVSSSMKTGPTPSQIHDLIESLPRNAHWDKAAGKVDTVDEQARPLEILEEEDDDESKDDAEEGLTIAWQYRKSVQDERLGLGTDTSKRATSKEFCHSFDLNGRLSEQDFNRDCVQIAPARCCANQASGASCSKRACGFRLYQQLLRQLTDVLSKSKDKLVRLLLYRAPVDTVSIALPLLLAHIRSKELPVVVFVTVQAWDPVSNSSSLTCLRRAADVVMQAEGFAARTHYPPPPEFRHLHGLLVLPKVSTVTAASAIGGGHFADMTKSKRPAAHVYGVKRDRRKLHVALLHIPPEDYAGAGSVGGGAVRSGAGRSTEKKQEAGCGSATSGNSLLDF